jgi:solute carrier family 45 protein 1/2/4
MTDATRAGSKALFMNAVVNLSTSVFLPFLVSSSGIRAEPTPVSTHSGEALTVRASRLMQKLDKIRAIIKVPSRLRMQLPLPGFTLIRAWILGQAVFAGTMFATWFAGSVASAQAIICVNGFCWGVAQCELLRLKRKDKC